MTETRTPRATEKKTRNRKLSAAQIISSIQPQALAIKVETLKLLKEDIENDRKGLQEQLALIDPDAGK